MIRLALISLLLSATAASAQVCAPHEKQNWTVLNVMPNGWSCIMGAGNGYVSKVGKPGEAL